MKNIEKENCYENNKQCQKEKFWQRKWFKSIFSATVFFGVLSIIFWIFPYSPNKPFTATIQITNWEEAFFPKLELEIDGEWKEKQIDKKGIAEFNKIPSKYDNKKVSIKITDTENMPYDLNKNEIQICEDKISQVQVRLRGLEKLQGIVKDENGFVADAIVRIDDIKDTTDERGLFVLEIPFEKQKRYQQLSVIKEGYEPFYDNSISMLGDDKCEIMLKQKK